MNAMDPQRDPLPWAREGEAAADEPRAGLLDVLTWIGEGKKLIIGATIAAGLLSIGYSLLLTDEFTARATLLPPGSQQSGSSGALAALGALGGLGNLGGLVSKSPDELYVALLQSDTVQRVLADRFDLRTRWGGPTYEHLRRLFPLRVRVKADKKSGVISVEVDDQDPKFAADLANAYTSEVTKLLGRLAVSEAQQRRVFFEQQLKETKDNLVKAEQGMRQVQEKSGVIALDKQAEALLGGAAVLRAQIVEREVQLKVLRTAATEQNPDVQRLNSELRALRAELARMESSQAGTPGSATDMPVGKLPEAGLEYIRARRELKLQEALLESMLRQYEIAKLDEAKEGPVLQAVDVALPPDRKSKPHRSIIVIACTVLGLLGSTAWVVFRRYSAVSRAQDPAQAAAWDSLARAWGWRRRR